MASKPRKPIDLLRRGWTAADFGIPTTQEVRNNLSTLPKGPGIIGTPPAGTTYLPLQQTTPALEATEGKTPEISWDDAGSMASYFLDPLGFVSQQQQDPEFMKAIEAKQGPVGSIAQAYANARTTSLTFLQNLFNVDDEKENVVETVWDGVLKGFSWPYEKLNQLTVAGLSALPGGSRTLSWDEAANATVGQMLVANPGISVGKVRRGEASLGDYLEAYNPLGIIGQFAGSVDPNNKVQQAGFDVSTPEGQAAMSTGWEKFFSGVGDIGFMFADPLLVGGKVAKIARIRWVDKPIVTEAQRLKLTEDLAKDNVFINNGTPNNVSPVGSFVRWATEKAPDGTKLRSVGEIYNHPVIKDAADRDVLTSAMMMADNFEDGALIMRSAYGDIAARKELFAKRADIVAEIGQANRKLIEDKIRFDPSTKKKTVDSLRGVVKERTRIVTEYERAFKRSSVANGVEPPALMRARADLFKSQQDLDAARNVRLDNIITRPLSKADLQASKKILDDLVARDETLKRALNDSIVDSFAQANRQFSSNTAVGRLVERSRQRRATSAYQSQATQGLGWKSDTYFQKGRFVRGVRVWRWFGQETPAGYVATRGVGAVESGREIMAMLNTLKMYSGASKTVTVGKDVVEVGGIARKEQLMNQYFATVGTGVKDQNIMQKSLMALEEQIFNDIGAYHGIDKSVVRQTYAAHNQARMKLLEEIKDRGYWASQNGDEISIEKAPWLDSQIENGMYMMNFREAERLARVYSKQGVSRTFAGARMAAGNKFNQGYEVFNALWRPAVLLRLGYTQRNVAEGLFRSMAYLSSVRPLVDASKAMYYGVRNPVVRRQVAAEVKRTEEALSRGSKLSDQMGTKFGKWWKNELEVLDGRIAREQEWLDDTIADLKASNIGVDEAEDVYKTLFAQDRMLGKLKSQKELLMTERGALTLYGKQASAARRSYDGLLGRTDPIPWRNAFNDETDYTPIALLNASADNTVKQMLQLRYDASNSILSTKRQRMYVKVELKDGDAYWEGVAQMLNQYKASEVGQLVLNGATARDIGRFLRSDPVGKEISAFLTGNEKWRGPDIGADLGEAEVWGQEMINRLTQLAPNPELVTFLQSNVRLGAGRKAAPVTGADVKRFLDQPQFRDKLGPAIGNIAEESASFSVRNMYKTGVQKAFHAIGTVPEDALVRFPFYGQQYERTAMEIRSNLLQQYGEKIPLSEINRGIMQAHRRALRDTRNYLFTIQRRTNLGDKAESWLPFVSATQNSVTSLGRLIWKDPSLPFILKNIWQAPDVMGWTDDQGNISVPIPHDWIPDGLEEKLGIKDLTRVTFDKNAFNVIFPESGYTFIPRPSPLVMVGASELMKHNWLGLSVDPPELIKSVLGDENAQFFWEQFKSYTFGEQGGVSAKPVSWDMLASPVMQKAFQMFQGTDSKEYATWYNKFWAAETAKAQAGLRDQPEKQEIINMTNNFQLLRMGANLLAFTPPQYESNMQPLMDAMRFNDQIFGLDGAWKSAQMYGPTLALLGDLSTSKNVAGTRAETGAVARARRYSDVIQDVAPSINQDNLSALGMVLNSDVEGYYDESAYAWQFSNKIPGVSEYFRELQTPEEAFQAASRNAGWTVYIKFMDQMKALADQQGLASWKKSPDLSQTRKDFIDKLSEDPMYEGWAQDFEDPLGTRTQDTVRVLATALSNDKFAAENTTPVWQAARLYLSAREEIAQMVKDSGYSSIDSAENFYIKATWDDIREQLITSYNGWGTLANRYLSADDNPKLLRETMTLSQGSA